MRRKKNFKICDSGNLGSIRDASVLNSNSEKIILDVITVYNGIEIVEGDVFVNKLGDRFIVQWDHKKFQYIAYFGKHDFSIYLHFVLDTIKNKIGNVFQSPELQIF